MKKLIFIGENCQVPPLRELLLQNPNIVNDFDIEVRANFSEFNKQSEEIDNLFRRADVYIYQPISEVHFHYHWKYVSENLLKPECIVISFPVLYFSGYWPDFKTRGNHRVNAIFPYSHTKLEEIISDCEQNVRDILYAAMNPYLFDKDEIDTSVEQSIMELERRENDLDIQVCDFIKNNYTKIRLFHTPNHPSTALMTVVTNKILTKLKYETIKDNTASSEPLGIYQLLIYPSVMKRLNLEFINPQSNINLCSKINKYPNMPNTANIETYIKWFVYIMYNEEI